MLSKQKVRLPWVFVCLFVLCQISLWGQSTDLLNKKVTLNADDASLSQVLSQMADLADCNIVLATDMAQSSQDKDKQDESKVTIHIKDVPIEQALGLVVKSVGLSYRLIGDKTFLVGDREKIEKETGERSYVVTLNYADVATVDKALKIMPGKTVPIEGQNALLIVANPQSFADIQNRIKEIDVPKKQIEIRARLIEVNVTESENIGIDWSKLNSITTIIAENPTNGSGVGLPYNFSDATGATPYGDDTNLYELPETQYWQKIDGWDNIGHFSRQLTAFDVTLNFLLENNAASILTDTRITAKDGEEANIHIGEVVPYVVQDRDYEVQVEKEEVGIKLDVKPSVNKDGLITTKISPEVSSVTELVGGYVPRTKVRKVNSTVTVRDGQKILVGGLLNSDLTTKTQKIPLLGSLPFIGKLFQHKEEVLNNTDLIIEITPRIVTDAAQDYELNIDPRLERHVLVKEAGDDNGDRYEMNEQN